MRVTNRALLSLILAGGANAFAPELSGLMNSFAPEYPGRMLLGGRDSILDMAGSYLDHLGKPSFSSPETAPAGPKTSYMYTNKGTKSKGTSGASSGSYLSNMGTQPPLEGASAPPPPPPVAVVVPPPVVQVPPPGTFESASTAKFQPVASGGDYMTSLTKQPATFAKPAGGFMYKGVPKTGAASKPGVSNGNYLDSMLASAVAAAPVAVVAAAPAVAVDPHVEPAPAGEAAWAVANPSSYLDALGSGAGSSGALKRSGGYMYKPTGITGGKRGLSGYLDNVSGSAAAPAGPAGYLDKMSGPFTGGKRQGGYTYKPAGTGQKKPASGGYLDNVGNAPLAQAEPEVAPPAQLATTTQSAIAPQDVAPAVRAPAKFEVPDLPGAPGGLNPLSGGIDRPTAGWIPVPRPGGGTPSPPNPLGGQGDRPSWNENPVQREISGTPSEPNALSGQGERPSVVGAGPVTREVGGVPTAANALSGQGERPSALDSGAVCREIGGIPTASNALSGQVERPSAVDAGAVPREISGTPVLANAESGQGERPSAHSDPSQSRAHGVPQLPNALSGGGTRPSEVMAQAGLNNVLNMEGSAPSSYVAPTLVGRPIANTARPSAALRAPGAIYGQTPEASAPVQATSAPEIPRPSAPADAGGLNNVANMDSPYSSSKSSIAPVQNPLWGGVVEEQAIQAAPMSAVAALTRNQPDFVDAFGTGSRSTLLANPESASSTKPGQQPSFVFPLQVNSQDF